MKLNIQLFAGGTITGSSTASIGRVQIVWTATASDAIENKSSVSASVQVKRSNAYNTTGTFSGTLWINGTAFSIKKKFDPISNSWKTVGSATLDVPHNEDGTKTIEIKTSFSNTGTSMAGTYTASANVALDTIPRASAFNSFSMSVNNDSSISVVASITKRNTSFTDTLNICNENITLSNGTNYITFSSSSHATAYNRFYALMGNQLQANYTAVLTTSSSGTQIGNTSAITAYNVALPSYALSVSAITSSDDNANVYIRSGSTHKVSDFTGTNTFLQGWSNPRLSYTLGATHNTLYGNLISITGATTKSGVGLGNDSFTLGTNFTGGTKTINATDGRKSASNSLTLTRKDWATPSVSITLTRESATGTQVNWVVSWNYTNVSGGITPKLNALYTYNGTTTSLISDRSLTQTSGSLSGSFQLTNADDYKYPISGNATLTDTIDYLVQSNIQIPGGLPAIYVRKDANANNLISTYGRLGVNGDIGISGNLSMGGYANIRAIKNEDYYTNHYIELGYAGHNSIDFYENGGTFNFYRSDAGTNNLITSINNNGITIQPYIGGSSMPYVQIGPQNYQYCHYLTNADNHYFNKPLRVNGNVYVGPNYDKKLQFPCFIRARATSNQQPDTSNGQLNVLFQAVDINNASNYLELKTDGKITVISSDVHHIKVDCTIWVERGSTSYAWCHLWVGSTDICNYMLANRNNGEAWQSVHLSGIASVSYGTQITPNIYFNVNNSANGTMGGTYNGSVVIDVEVLD